MPKAMSFFMTTQQIKDQTKDVTRRLGWTKLEPGTELWAVEKVQGLKKGEKHNRLALIRVADVSREPLGAITQDECKREGFPQMTPEQFIEMMCRHYGIRSHTMVTRIEFEYV